MGLLLLMGNSFSGALDSLGTGLESAWSVGRRLRAAYTGPVIRVRRGSDNAEQDFSGSGALGAVDTAAVAAFCGAGDGFLTTIYGQTGSRNFTQSTTGVQPIVCESGVAVTSGGRLAAKFVAAAARRMTVASSQSLYNFLHTTGGAVSIVSTANDTATGKTLLANKNTSTRAGLSLARGSAEGLQANIGRRDVAGVATDGLTASIATSALSTSNSVSFFNLDPDNGTAAERFKLWFNGTANAAVNAETATPFVENSFGLMTLGADSGASGPHDGLILEVVIWSQTASVANRDLYESNAGTFYGITVA